MGVLLVLVLGGAGLGLWFRHRAPDAGGAPWAELAVNRGEVARVGGTGPEPGAGGAGAGDPAAADTALTGTPPVVEGDAGAGASPVSEGDGVVVHVTGSVREPGVYTVKQGGRVADAVAAAGGAADQARLDVLNLAERLEDGQKVYVPSQADVLSRQQGGGEGPLWPGDTWDEAGGTGGGRPGKVNINRADAGVLEGLPGIGPALANRIIDYRRRHGPFRRPEDLRNVSGIGPAKFNELRDYIVVD